MFTLSMLLFCIFWVIYRIFDPEETSRDASKKGHIDHFTKIDDD